jgi:hypothetical protein
MAGKRRKKTTAEEIERMRREQEWIDEIIRRRLEREGLTREEVYKRVGWPDPDEPI